MTKVHYPAMLKSKQRLYWHKQLNSKTVGNSRLLLLGLRQRIVGLRYLRRRPLSKLPCFFSRQPSSSKRAFNKTWAWPAPMSIINTSRDTRK